MIEAAILYQLDKLPSSASARCVWLVLCAFGASQGPIAVSLADISKKSGCSVPSVKRAVDLLQARGFLMVTARAGRGVFNVYRVPSIFAA
jgi:DNA-binding MarR family transcriptional regulator